MQLSYRGVRSQNSNLISEIHKNGRFGIDRGAIWYKHPLTMPLVPTAIARLKYRGVNYLHSYIPREEI